MKILYYMLCISHIALGTLHNPSKKAVFVLGAPRSGTSVTTGILHHLGLDLGPKLTQPQSWNPKGDFEDAATVELNRKLIRDLNIDTLTASHQPIDWEHDPKAQQAQQEIKDMLSTTFKDKDVFGLKHPRVSLLLPGYLNAAQELGYDPTLVIVSRYPKDIVRSLNRSEKQIGNEYSMEEGLKFVYRFLRPIAQHAADYPHVRITFNEITGNTPTAIEKIRTILPELDSYDNQKDIINAFVSPRTASTVKQA